MRFAGSTKSNVFAATLIIVVMLFVVGFSILAIYDGLQGVAPELISSFNSTGSNQSRDIISDQYTSFPPVWDSVILFIFIGLWAAAFITSWMIETNPIFFVTIMFLLVPVSIVGMVLANTYEDFSESEHLETTFPMTFWIMTHLLAITIVLGSLCGVMLYMKAKTT